MEKEDRIIDIETISKDVDSLLNFANTILTKKVEFDFYEDSFALMILCFFTKQIEHLRSIRFLINSYQYSDTMIIARVMIEGLAILARVYKNPSKYATKWRSYAVVSDYKLYKKNIKKVTKDEEDNILELLKIHGEDFHYKNLKRKFRKNNVNEFPYTFSWLVDDDGKEIKKSRILRDIDKQLYEIYSELSGWIHWDIGSIGQYIKKINDKIEIKANSSNDAALSLAAGFQSLFGVTEILNHHFKLAFNEELNNIKVLFLSNLQKLQKSDI